MSASPSIVSMTLWSVRRRALFISLAGAALFFIGGIVQWLTFGDLGLRQLFYSYLVGYIYILGISIGCLVILMIQYLTGGQWGFVARRILEAASSCLIIIPAMFIPIAVAPFLGDASPYEWARPSMIQIDEQLQHQAIYLNRWSFLVRAIAFFFLWIIFGACLYSSSIRQDKMGGTAAPSYRGGISAIGLIVYSVTITFASIDWVMSLEPHWYSSIFPVLFAVSQILSGFAFMTVVLLILASRRPLLEVVDDRMRRSLGGLLLTFIILWAYMSYSQFLLIWTENLPQEISWYLRRSTLNWQWFVVIILLVHFAIPVACLLSRDLKESPRGLSIVAICVLVARFLDIFWWIEPTAVDRRIWFFGFIDLAAVASLGGIWVSVFLTQLGKHPLLPIQMDLTKSEKVDE